MSKGTVVVIGGGGGGLAAAALQCKKGCKNILFERDSVVGGKAKASSFMGYWIDEEFHAMVKVGDNKAFRDKVGAPPGKQKIQIHMYLDKTTWSHAVAEQYAAEVFMPRLRSLYPDIDRHIEFTMTYLSPPGTFATMMNQMFGNPVFIPEKSPIDNFHFVGMYGGSIGMEGILVSGARVAEDIVGETLIEK